MARRREVVSGALKGTQAANSPITTRQGERSSRDQLRETTAAKLEKFAHHPNPEVYDGSEAVQPPVTTKLGKQDRGLMFGLMEGGVSGNRDTMDNEKCMQHEEITKPHSEKESSDNQKTEPTLNEIMLAIKHCTTTVTGLAEQVQNISVDISLIRQETQKIRERTEELEKRVSEAEDMLTPLNKGMGKMKQDIEGQAQKLEDFENRMRRNNLRIVGFPEKAEGSNPIEFLEKWLMETVGKEHLSHFLVERAHRVPIRMGVPGAISRPFLIRIQNYRDKETILRRARILQELIYDNGKIMIFPDYSPEVRKKRASFQEVKKRLQRLKIQYAMLYPAKLRIQTQDSVQFFATVEAVTDWLDRQYS